MSSRENRCKKSPAVAGPGKLGQEESPEFMKKKLEYQYGKSKP
jgi:hypothetical protein